MKKSNLTVNQIIAGQKASLKTSKSCKCSSCGRKVVGEVSKAGLAIYWEAGSASRDCCIGIGDIIFGIKGYRIV